LVIASEATPNLDLNIVHSTAHMKGAGITVCIPTGLQADSPRFKSQKEKEIFSLQHSDQLCSQPSPLFNVHQGSFMREKRLRSEVNHHLHLRR
jgi:hypothetical protein